MSDVDKFFAQRGWRKMEQPVSPSVYVNDYAALGFTTAATEEQIADGWSRWQAALLQLRKQPEVGDRKDLYLVIVLADENPQALMHVQPIVDDTNVCRKIILPQRDGSVVEALVGAPFFQVVDIGENRDDGTEQMSDSVLNESVMSDLAKRSASTIFDHLLANKYRRTDET